MASHLIEQYVAELGRDLPLDTVDEVTDGLYETWQHHRQSGLSDEHASHAAIAEFGTARQIIDAFVANASGRRTARLLLATGPPVGVCWGLSLIMAKAWTWPIPQMAAALFAVGLLTAVGCLILAATARHSYRRTRLGRLGALSLVVLDAAMLAAVLAMAPAIVWPMAIAVPASLARIGFAVCSVPKRFRPAVH